MSAGCKLCYAERVAARFSAPGQPYHGFAQVIGTDVRLDGPKGPSGTPITRWTGKLALVEKHLADPLRWRRPRRIFVNSMSDLFHEALADDAIDRVFAVMALAPQHTFQVLTKRPERMRAYLDGEREGRVKGRAWEMLGRAPLRKYNHVDAEGRNIVARPWPLPNVWLGVSVEDQASADERIPELLATPAAVRFVSYEPALGPVDFERWIFRGHDRMASEFAGCALKHNGIGNRCETPEHWSRGLHWLIVGGESGPGARPCDVAWIRSAVEDCRRARVPVFVKQFGARPITTAAPLPVEQSADSIMRHGEYDPDPLEWTLLDSKGGDPSEWPEDLRVREFPEVSHARR